MDNTKLFIKVIDTYAENGGIMHTDEADTFNEEQSISNWFGGWVKPIKGHLEVDSEYFYTYDDSFSDMNADMKLDDGDGKYIYLFFISKH